jgi:pimeloyl-ACP methyl ester carboxylesterase
MRPNPRHKLPTYLLVHGFPSSSFEYHRVLPELRKHGRVVMLDALGFALDPWLDEGGAAKPATGAVISSSHLTPVCVPLEMKWTNTVETDSAVRARSHCRFTYHRSSTSYQIH